MADTRLTLLPTEEVEAFDPATRLAYWRALAAFVKQATEVERELRKQVVKEFFPNGAEGTNNYELPDGSKLKATIGITYKLDKDKIDDALEQIERIGNDGNFIAERLVTWAPSLSVSEFKKLDDASPSHAQIKEVIQTVLTTSPSTPTLEIIEPKVKV
jgi:hypothetical protein